MKLFILSMRDLSTLSTCWKREGFGKDIKRIGWRKKTLVCANDGSLSIYKYERSGFWYNGV
jgi:hypothetical protein